MMNALMILGNLLLGRDNKIKDMLTFMAWVQEMNLDLEWTLQKDLADKLE